MTAAVRLLWRRSGRFLSYRSGTAVEGREPAAREGTPRKGSADRRRGRSGERHGRLSVHLPARGRVDDVRARGPGRVTLIEEGAFDALRPDYEIEFGAGDSRRNIVTRGVALNHLVGREFRVGDVALRGIRLCEPCRHLEQVTGRRVRAGLVHRGGLRAQILTAGSISTGDPIEPVEPEWRIVSVSTRRAGTRSIFRSYLE
ncbi:MAG TPA: MOSC domain-containing protein [bacterium]|nr:MOSC domain-containing protein [bacterium]